MSRCNLPFAICLRQIVSEPLGHPPFPTCPSCRVITSTLDSFSKAVYKAVDKQGQLHASH